jgi:hypothetical protein
MATIGSLIVEIAGNNSRLRKSLNESASMTAQFRQQIAQARYEFSQSATRLREDLFSGVLSPAEFRKQGQIASKEYNDAILKTIGDVRSSGRLTPRLHATLVSELRETGLEAGQAAAEGVEAGSAPITSTLARRFQSTGVMVAFALEGMAEGSESMSRRALRSISLLAFAFGPEAGGITLAITTAGQFMLDFFHKAQKEAEETSRKFRQEIANMARGNDFAGAARQQQYLYSGDPFAAIEGQRKDETEAQFKARRLGIIGVTAEIQRLQGVLRAAPFDPGAALAGGSEQSRNARAALKDMQDQLAALQTREKEIQPVQDFLFGKGGQAEQLARGALQVASYKKEVKDAKKDQIALLNEELSSIEGTRTALQKLGMSVSSTQQPLVDIYSRANTLLDAHLVLLRKQGQLYDKQSLQLEDIRAKTLDILIGQISISKTALAMPIPTSPGAPLMRAPDMPTTGITIAGRAGVGSVDPLTGYQKGALRPGYIGTPQVAPITRADPSIGEARLRVAVDVVREDLASLGSGIKSVVSSGFFAALRSIAGQLNPFQQVISAISDAAAPLAPVMTQIAQVVGAALKPVFEAFVPVLRALVPIITAVLQVLAPILKALAPLFMAFVPILRAMFPVFKFVAIAATYIGQAFATVASLVLRAGGNIIIVWGQILKALATAIDKLPFVSAKGAINAAQGIIDFGNSLLDASDEFKEGAKEMGEARGEIAKVNIDTTDSIAKLGEAAAETADALKNVPQWWKANIAVWQAAHPLGGGSPAPAVPFTPRGSDTHTPSSGLGTGFGFGMPGSPVGGGNTSGGTDGGGAPLKSMSPINIENINIEGGSKDGRVLLREIIDEAKRMSQATFGTTARWAEVL